MQQTACEWDPRTGRVIRTLGGGMPPLHILLLSFLFGSDSFSFQGGGSIGTPDGPITYHAIASSPDGRLLAGNSTNGMKISDLKSGRDLRFLRLDTAMLTSAAFSADGQRLAVAYQKSNESEVKVWHAISGQELLSLKGGGGCIIVHLAFSPDERLLAAASSDGNMILWDAASGKELHKVRDMALWQKGAFVCRVAFSPDSQRIAFGISDGTLKLHNATTGQEILTLRGHDRPVACLAFHPNGSRLASAGDDGTVKLWDAMTGEETLSLRGHTQLVSALTFSPDGYRLASAGSGSTVRIWDATPLQETSHQGASNGR